MGLMTLLKASADYRGSHSFAKYLDSIKQQARKYPVKSKQTRCPDSRLSSQVAAIAFAHEQLKAVVMDDGLKNRRWVSRAFGC